MPVTSPQDSEVRSPEKGTKEVDIYSLFSTVCAECLWKAPEILRGDAPESGTKEGDIYSFGIILSELVTRASPFERETDFITLDGNAPYTVYLIKSSPTQSVSDAMVVSLIHVIHPYSRGLSVVYPRTYPTLLPNRLGSVFWHKNLSVSGSNLYLLDYRLSCRGLLHHFYLPNNLARSQS